MKKFICMLLLVWAGAAVFGTEFYLSTGAGGLVGGLFTRDTFGGAVQNVDQFNYGFFAFFDATFGVLSVSFQNGLNSYRQTTPVSNISENMSGKGSESMLGLSLLGKYPFYLDRQFTVFPLLGIEYQISLAQKRTDADGKMYRRENGDIEKDKDDKAFQITDWNSFFINVGGGVDIQLPQNFYLRGELLYGFRLMTLYEQKNIDIMKSYGVSNPKLGGLSSGPSIRISAGWCFYSRAFGR